MAKQTPVKPNPEDAPVDFDDLIDGADDDTNEPDNTSSPEPAPLTPTQARIAQIRAELAAMENDPDAAELEALEAQLAARRSGRTFMLSPEKMTFEEGKVIQFHIVNTGLTAFGQVLIKGQLIEVTVGDERWNSTLNRKGESWITLLDDVEGQYAKWGKQYIAPGQLHVYEDDIDADIARPNTRKRVRVPFAARD